MRRDWPKIVLIAATAYHLLVCHVAVCQVKEAGPPRASGTPAESPPLRAPLGISRVKMPADRIDAFLRESGVKYVRVPADEFERLSAFAGEGGAGKTVGTYLREARFSASLAEDGTLLGRALLEVQHSADRWRLLPLSPCALAIRESEGEAGDHYFGRWTGKPARRAALGVGEDGRLGVIVEKSGELEFAWSLRGRRRDQAGEKEMTAEGESLTFRLELPPATVRTLELELPPRWAPRISQGAVETLDASGKETKRWRIRLPGGAAFDLSLVDASAKPPMPDVTLRQSYTYRLWPQGIDVQTDLSLDVTGGPLQELEVDLAPGLVLLGATTGAKQRISWSPPDAPRVRLHLPQPLSGPKQVIHVEATAPLRLDRSSALPTVRPRGVFWQEGVATVWLEKSLSLAGLTTRGGRQWTGLEPQSFGQGSQLFLGSQLSVRLFGPEAGVEVLVARGRPRIEVSQATRVTWGPNELSGRTSADVTCLEGECFDLWAEVGVRWSLEAVEATPSDALTDWELERQPLALLVHIRLAKPLKAGESLRLALTGRHLASAGAVRPAPLGWDDLLMLTFRDARPVERLWSVDAAPGGGTVRLGDSAGVRELAAGDLTAAQRRLFNNERSPVDRPPQGLVLAVDAATPQLEVVAERSRASLPTTLDVQALVAADKVRDAATHQAAITVIRDADGVGTPGAIVRRARLDSSHQPSGGVRHLATFEIENHGLSAAQLLLPSGAEHVEVRIDGVLVPVQPDDAEAITIPLDRGRRQVEVDYDAEFPGLGLFTTVEPVLPRLQSGGSDLPVLQCAWRIIAPPGYEVLSAPPWQSLAPATGGASWARRLLGPLASMSDDGNPAREEASPLSKADRTLRAGWRSHTLLGAADSPLTAQIVHQRTLDAVGWAMFLAVSLGVCCFGPRSGKQIALAAAALVAAAMLVPGYCVPVAGGMLWGFLAGLLLTVLWSRSRPSTAASAPGEPPTASSLAHASTLSVIGLALVVGHAGGPGQAAEEAPPPVIVPTDAALPKGEQVVYVPEALWERWRQRRLEAASEHPWMIERADYVGRISAPPATGTVVPPSLTATFGLRTAGGPTRVRLDFGSPLGPFRPLDALLDGQLIGLAWDAAGRACTLDVPKAGAHALELQLRPNLRADGASWQLEHPLPPVAGAQVSLAFPTADMASAELVSATGAVTRSGRVLRGELGPTDRLVVRWPAGVASQPPKAEVDELLWLRVKTGAVSLRAKWVFNVHRGQIRQFRLAADRRLRLNGDFRDGEGLKIRHEGESLSAPRTAVGPQQFTLTLDPARSGRFSVEGEFLVEDTHGIGRLRYPRVTVVDVPVDRRRLAVSVDADLEYDQTAPKGKPRTSVGEFLAAWGDKDGQPLLVRDGSEVGPDWSLAVRPRELRRAVQQTLWVDFGSGRAEVKFQADVTTTAAPCFHHRLTLPSDLVVEQVTVTEGSQRREAHWTAAAGTGATPGALNVFLRDRAAGTQRIEIHGFLPVAASGAVTLPAIQFDRDQALTTSAETRVSRQPTVRVTLEPSKTSKKPAPSDSASGSAATGPDAAVESSGAPDGYTGSRFVAALATPPGTKLQVNLQPNRPRVRSPILLTTLRKEAEGWLADVVYDLFVMDELDAVTFVAPAGLGEPAVTDPPGRLEGRVVGGRARWRYVPHAALTGASRVALSWRLPAATAQRVEVPAIDVLTTSSVERLVALPQALRTAAEAWEPEGLARVSSLDEVLPSALAKEAQAKTLVDRRARLEQALAGFDLYRAPARGAAAVLRRSVAEQGQVRATGAAVEWQFSSDAAYHGLAKFALATQGPEAAIIRLPDGCRLVRCTWAADSSEEQPPRGELPLVASPTDDHAWRVSLGPQRVPRTLEVVFAGKLTAPLAGDCRLQSPILVDVPVEETSWTVTLPPGWAARPPDDAESRMAEGRQVVSLTLDGAESQTLRLAVHAQVTDSLWRRVLVLAALLGVGGGLVWAIGRFPRRRQEPLIMGTDPPVSAVSS